jgi:hypothetical protein
VGYVFLAPAMALVSLYLVVFLALNSRVGASLLAGLLSDQLAGSLDYGYLSVGPDLRRIDLWSAEIRDPGGRAAVQVRHLGCSFNPLPLLERRLVFSGCDGSDGRILIEQQDGRYIGLVRAFQGDFLRKKRHRNPLTIVFENIDLRRVDILINTQDLLFLFEQIDITEGSVVVAGSTPDIGANMVIPRGRIMLSERIFSLGDGKSTLEDAEFELLRTQRPWAAARTRQPHGTRGMLELPIVAGRIDGFRWVQQDFRLEHVTLRSLDNLLRLDASGLFGILPERPPRYLEQAGGLRFDGRLTLRAHPDSPLFDWFFPGLFEPPSRQRGITPEIAPLVLDAWGNLRFADVRSTRLQLRDITLLGWRIDAADLGVTLENGRVTLAPDSSIEAFGGRVTGSGSFVPRSGVWDLGLCIDGLGILDAARPFVGELSESLRTLLDLRLSTVPSRCVDDETFGVALAGDLTRKALEIDPAATTPIDKEIQPPMIAAAANDIVLAWERRPGFLPSSSANLQLDVSLDQRGRLTFGAGDGPGLVARVGGDRAAFTGVFDSTRRVFEPSSFDVATSELASWVSAFGGPQLPRLLSLRASARIAGPVDSTQLNDLVVQAALPSPSGVWPEFAAELRGDIVGDSLLVHSMVATSPVGSVDASGQIDLFDGSATRLRQNPTLALDWQIADVLPGFWTTILGEDAQLNAHGNVSGALGSPELFAETLVLTDVVLVDEPIERIEATNLLLSNNQIDVERFELAKGSGLVSGDFAWDVETDAVLGNLVVRDVNLRDLRTIAALGVPLRGDARVDLVVRGSLAEPDVEGAVIVTGLEVDRRRIGQAVFAIDSWDQHIHVNGSVGGQLTTKLQLPLPSARDEIIRLAVSFQRLPLEQFWPAFARSVERSWFTGGINAEYDPATQQARADLELTDLLVRVGARDFGVPRPIRASWSAEPSDGQLSQSIRVHEMTISVEERELTLRGTILLDPDDPRMSLSLGGDLDFSLLQLLPQLVVDAEGVADVSLKVFGPIDNPAIDGEAVFGSARIAPRGLGTSIMLDPGTLRVETGRLVIDENNPITGTLFGGDLSLYGVVGLRGIVPDSAEISAFVTDLAYRVPDAFQVTLTGPVNWRAGQFSDVDSWAIDGDLTLVDGRFMQDFDIISDQFAFGGFGRGVEQFALPIWVRVPAVGRMLADIRLSGRDRFFVTSRVAGAALDMEFRTELAVTGRLEAMDVRGEMEALEGGTVAFRGQSFEATDVVLGFRGYRDPNGFPMPYLDAELTASIIPCSQQQRSGLAELDVGAVTDTNRVFLTAWVSGQLPIGLNFRLESTPFYDQRDQLSLILTGCTVDALTGGSGGAPTLDAVLRPLLDVVERNVEQRLSLDQVDVAPSADGTAGIQIQDEVTERFRWTLDALFGTSETQRQVVRGEYRLFDWLVLEVQEQTSSEEPVRIDAGVRFRVVFD